MGAKLYKIEAASLAVFLSSFVFYACLQPISSTGNKWNGNPDAARKDTGVDAGRPIGDNEPVPDTGPGDAGPNGHDETPNPPDETILPPVVTGCAIENSVIEVLLDQPVVFTCTADHGSRPVLWRYSAVPISGHFTELGNGRASWVLKPVDLNRKPDFTDTDFTITADAADAEYSSVRGSRSFNMRVIGNLWIADQDNHCVMAVGSDGTRLADVIGPLNIQQPTGLLQLSDGNVLVGEELKDRPKLQVFDKQGNLLSAFSEVNLRQEPLFEEYEFPRSMIEHSRTGQVWVTVRNVTDNSHVHIFQPDGTFSSSLSKPEDHLSAYRLSGITELSNGNVLVTSDDTRTVFLYSSSGTLLTRSALAFGQDEPTHIHAALRLSSGDILMAGRFASYGILGKFTESLGFIDSSDQEDKTWNIYMYYLIEHAGYVMATSAQSYQCVYLFEPETLDMPELNCWSDSVGLSTLAGMIKLR